MQKYVSFRRLSRIVFLNLSYKTAIATVGRAIITGT